MKKRIYTNNKYLKPFFTEINKYTDGVHSLNSGIDIRYIEETERKLNITLPNIYKDFLQVCNGGEFFIPGTVFSEVYNPTYGEKRNGTPYLDESFKRRLPAMPDSLLIIADLNYGDAICFDLMNTDQNDAKVIQWNKENQSIEDTWDGFVEWLMDMLDEGSMLVDYDGEEKDLDF